MAARWGELRSAIGRFEAGYRDFRRNLRRERPGTMNDAEKCRINGWGVGTILEGGDLIGAARIELTAIGEKGVLARQVETRGDDGTWRPFDGSEHLWTLSCREWRRVGIPGSPSTSSGDAPPGAARL
jgi:hypothetical protein